MSRQITVRLPDELVTFVDQLVEHGQAGSRAVVVAQSLERERRHQLAAQDAAILAQSTGADDDLDDLARFTARTRLDDLD